MACVDADADSIRIFHAVDDRGDLLKAVPQHRPLARGCFDNREDPRSVRPVMGVVQRFYNQAEAGGFSRAHVSSGMKIEKGDPESFTAAQLIDERFPGFSED